MGDELLARAALQRVLPALAPAAVADASFRPLAGGINKRSWLVAVDGNRYVLRLPTPGAQSLLDVAAEAAAMSAASRAGLAPRVVAVDVASGVLLTEFRANTVAWTAAAARLPANIERAAELLRALHAVPVELPAFAAERIARAYLAELGEAAALDSRSAMSAAKRGAELLDLARRYDAVYAPTALCHNDLVAANVLDDGELVLVDFEYAVRGAPVLDLASLAGMNDFSVAQQRELLASYCRDAGYIVTAAELAGTVRMVRLLAWFWAELGVRRMADAAPYARLAAQLDEALR